MPDAEHMQRFWDERAREDAFFFVDDRLEYGNPDVERFFSDGEADLDQLLGMAGAAVRPQDTVLDIGCGLGRLTRVLAGRAQSAIGLDVSAEMLRQARELNPGLENVTWVHGDGTTLAGVGDASCDAIVSHVVFQHIPDPKVTMGYVAEMGRVLRPGGWAVFQASNDPGIHRPQPGGLRRALARLAGRAPRGREDPAWVGSAIDLGELRSVADRAGMDVEQVENAGTQYCVVRLRRRPG